MLNTIPDEITFDEKNLHIRWKDGKECDHDLLTLRKNCPCATCRGGHGPVNRTTDNITSITMLNWDRVGRYGLQITWSDFHKDGIYTYELLRESCEKGITFPDD